MKTRSARTAGCLVLAGAILTAVVGADEESREWRSTSGTVVRGELVAVRDGKAIIRPETKLIEAPLDKLAETDREFAVAWAKKKEKRDADRAQADLLLAQTQPLGKALIGRTVIAKGKSVESYKIENIGNLDYVLLYLTQDKATGDVDALNRLYKRLRARYDNFEFIAMAYTNSTEESDKMLIEAEIEFPAVRPNTLAGEGVEPLTQLFSRRVVPQIAVIDRDGKIVSDSYRAPDPDARKKAGDDGEWKGPKQEMKQPLSDLQRLLRAAAKGVDPDE